MLVVVLSTFIGAGITNRRAYFAERCGIFASEREERGGSAAELGAFDIEPDAFAKMLPMLFPQAGYGAVIARGSTGTAGLDTGFEWCFHGVVTIWIRGSLIKLRILRPSICGFTIRLTAKQ